MLRLIHVFSYYEFTILALCTQLPGFKTRSRVKNKIVKIIGGYSQVIVSPVMLITLEGGRHNELEAA